MPSNSCPKCDRKLPESTLEECPYCGVILAKASAPRPRPATDEPNLAPPPPLGSGAAADQPSPTDPGEPQARATGFDAPSASTPTETVYGAEPTHDDTYAGATVGARMSDSLRTMLLQGSPWIRFMAVLFLLGAGLTLVSSFVLLGQADLGTGVAFGAFLFYVFIAGVYIYLGLTLLSAGRAQKRAAQEESFRVLEEALGYHTRYWRTLGILALVSLGLMVVGILAALALGFFLGASAGG